jgi:DNA-binding MarR family transcriptional regulator
MTVMDVTARTHDTQGAISQTISLMAADGLIERVKRADGRKSELHLTGAGSDVTAKLEPHWQATFTAIADLE